jgi:hypothetical protein
LSTSRQWDAGWTSPGRELPQPAPHRRQTSLTRFGTDFPPVRAPSWNVRAGARKGPSRGTKGGCRRWCCQPARRRPGPSRDLCAGRALPKGGPAYPPSLNRRGLTGAQPPSAARRIDFVTALKVFNVLTPVQRMGAVPGLQAAHPVRAQRSRADHGPSWVACATARSNFLFLSFSPVRWHCRTASRRHPIARVHGPTAWLRANSRVSTSSRERRPAPAPHPPRRPTTREAGRPAMVLVVVGTARPHVTRSTGLQVWIQRAGCAVGRWWRIPGTPPSRRTI